MATFVHLPNTAGVGVDIGLVLEFDVALQPVHLFVWDGQHHNHQQGGKGGYSHICCASDQKLSNNGKGQDRPNVPYKYGCKHDN